MYIYIYIYIYMYRQCSCCCDLLHRVASCESTSTRPDSTLGSRVIKKQRKGHVQKVAAACLPDANQIEDVVRPFFFLFSTQGGLM